MFSWIPIYTELATVLVGYEERQADLLGLLHEIKESGLPMIGLTDRGASNRKRPLAEIDPFTFFGVFNRGTTEEKRQSILRIIQEKLGLSSAVPDDFHGIPIIMAMDSWYFPYAPDRDSGDIPALWRLAKQAITGGLAAVQADAFDRALRVDRVGIGKLTSGLFWMRPKDFMPVDSRSQEYLQGRGIDARVGNFSEYRKLLEAVRGRLGSDFPAISREAYLEDILHVDRAREAFLRHLPGFNSFERAPERYVEGEDRYKREASAAVRKALAPYVSGGAIPSGDDEARDVLLPLLKMTNFINWRARTAAEEKLAAPRLWAEYLGHLAQCLRASEEEGWQKPFADLLAWLGHLGLSAGPVKMLATYFPFFWDPKRFYFVKPDACDTFLRLVGEKPLGAGRPLTVMEYERVLGVIDRVAAELDAWKPRDNIDIHGFAWIAAGGWDEVKPKPKPVIEPIIGPKPPPSIDVPLNLILSGPPGTGKTYRLLSYYKPMFGEENCTFVSFHPSYSYEDFVEGLRPVVDPDNSGAGSIIRYEVVKGVFKGAVDRALAQPDRNHVFFIDEINRANVASVFGELITLIEPDKRLRWSQESGRWEGIRVRLAYGGVEGEPFGIPNNLHLIGTMNTADRSIALMDYALRRRFVFEEMQPDSELLDTLPGPIKLEDGSTIDLHKLLDAMNQRIEYLFDRDHLIGHSYFVGVKSLEDLAAVFQQQIIPLLQEYFYGDWEKLQLVFADLTGDGDAASHPDSIIRSIPQRPTELFGRHDDAYALPCLPLELTRRRERNPRWLYQAARSSGWFRLSARCSAGVRQPSA